MLSGMSEWAPSGTHLPGQGVSLYGGIRESVRLAARGRAPVLDASLAVHRSFHWAAFQRKGPDDFPR